MCMQYLKKRSCWWKWKQWWHKHNIITVYKVVYIHPDKNMIVTPFQGTPIPLGTLYSNRDKGRPRITLAEKYNKEIYFGIHVFLDADTALANRGDLDIVLRCEALVEDFVGLGPDNHAVFTKINIPTGEIRRTKRFLRDE